MVSSQEIEAQMQLVAQVRQQALNEEKARLAKENANRLAVQEAEAELNRLRVERAEARFGEVLAESNALVLEQQAALAELYSGLDIVQQALAQLMPQAGQITTFFERQQAKHDEAIGAANELINAMPPMPASAQMDSGYETVMRNKSKLIEHEQRIQPAWTLPFALLAWIGQAQSPEELRLRSGIGYAVTGQIFQGDPNNLRNVQTLRENLKQQLMRISIR